MRIPSFGHAGDGNLHIYVCRDQLEDSQWKAVLEKVFALLYLRAHELGGLVSGEHGIGYAKKQYLSETTDPVQLEIMRGIKNVFDPKHILNPQKVF